MSLRQEYMRAWHAWMRNRATKQQAERCIEKRKAPTCRGFSLTAGGASRSRTGLNGFAGRCITALLSRRKRTAEPSQLGCKLHAQCDGLADLFDGRLVHQTKREALLPRMSGAGDESRTRDLNLGKVALYQLSYSRMVLHYNVFATTLLLYYATQNAASNLERETSLELATSTLARLRSTN
jgi:hypothetical protein